MSLGYCTGLHGGSFINECSDEVGVNTTSLYSATQGGHRRVVELSVIIPTYNRAAMLRACLQSLAAQKQSAKDFEVIVVVDGSTDKTSELLSNLTVPFRLDVVWQSNQGVGMARNQGIQASRGRYCLFLDDDILAHPALVAEHLRVQRATGGCLGLGHLTLELPSAADGFVRFLDTWWKNHYERLRLGVVAPSFVDCYTGNLSAPRAALVEVGGFTTDLPRCEDVEIAYRLQSSGLIVSYIPEASGQQIYRKNRRQVARDAENEGRADFELYRRHPAVLPHRGIGMFNDSTLRSVLLRRALLATRVQPVWLITLGRCMELTGREYAWYQFMYGYCYWHGVRHAVSDRSTWRRLLSRTLILMYHAIGDFDEPPSRYVVPGRRFKWQLAWLAWTGRHVMDLEDYVCRLREYRLPPTRAVVLTFDDGYRDTFTLSYPILRRHRMPVTVFLVTRAVGQTNDWDREGVLRGRPLLSWEDVQEMADGGVSFGAHTQTHASLTSLDLRRSREEISGSRADLERQLNLPVRLFAYPYGRYDAATRAAVEQAGYDGACAVHPGPNGPSTDPFVVRRIEVKGTYNLVSFACAAWLGIPDPGARVRKALRRGRWHIEQDGADRSGAGNVGNG
jgi:peptidoglycan/xylan/chitin deacetylase (PgdA/CDA1 family)/glycosyltransferase involved in cell wall biosynthesis